jgi:Fe-S cluster assembly protein SufD
MALTPWLSHFKTDFELARRRRGESIAFDALRCEAFDRFLLLGCPTQADERWRDIDIGRIAQTNFSLGAPPSASASREEVAGLPRLDVAAGTELTFINGYFVSEFSTAAAQAEGVLVAPLKAALDGDAEDVSAFAQIAPVDYLPMVALNTALFEDGACVIVPPETTIETPVHVRFFCNGEADAKPAMTQPRVLIVVGERGTARVIESYSGAPNVEYFTNAVTEIVLAEGARLEHHRMQHESDAAYHIAAAHVLAGPRSRYSAQCVNAGGALIRTETMATLGGDSAESVVSATNDARRGAVVNVHTAVDHAAPSTVSRQRYRWTLDDNALGILTGRTIVRPGASDARVRLASRARLRSPAARIEVKPTFDILAGDATLTQYSAIIRQQESSGAVRL